MTKEATIDEPASQPETDATPAVPDQHDLYRELFLSSPSATIVFDCSTLQLADCNDRAAALLLPEGAGCGLPRLTDCLQVNDPARFAEFCSTPGDSWSEFRARALKPGAGAGEFILRLKRLTTGGSLCQTVLHPSRATSATAGSPDAVYAAIFAHVGSGLTVSAPSLRILSMNPTIRS